MKTFSHTRSRRISIISAVLILFSTFLIPLNYALSQRLFQLVESVPVETTLEKSGLTRTFDVWLEMFNNAKQSIDIETFYFANETNEPLEKILESLKIAASKGVKIRIIVDKSFYEQNEKSVDLLEGINNIEIKKIPFKTIKNGVMHAKYFIIDREEIFLGSQNMDWRAIKHIHEIGARVKSKKLADVFLKIFETDWQLCENPDINNIKVLYEKNATLINSKNPLKIFDEYYGKIFLYPAFSPKDLTPNGYSDEEAELIKIIRKSKKRIHILMFAFSPLERKSSETYERIERELKKAAKRGVDIKIVFSDWAIKEGVTEYIKELSKTKGIEIKFSTIPIYSLGYIKYARVDHSKMFISDYKTSWISTSNWEKSYFYNCRNATLIIRNKKINEELDGVFNSVWESRYAEKIDINFDYKPVKRN